MKKREEQRAKQKAEGTYRGPGKWVREESHCAELSQQTKRAWQKSREKSKEKDKEEDKQREEKKTEKEKVRGKKQPKKKTLLASSTARAPG